MRISTQWNTSEIPSSARKHPEAAEEPTLHFGHDLSSKKLTFETVEITYTTPALRIHRHLVIPEAAMHVYAVHTSTLFLPISTPDTNNNPRSDVY